MANTTDETVELLYAIDPDHLTVDQQIALSQAYASLAQAEQLARISEQLHTLTQVMQSWAARSAKDSVARC